MLAARHLTLLFAVALAAGACATQGPPLKELASDQTLRLAIPSDISSLEPLDPAQISDPLAYAIGSNVFGGLYRYDDDLRLRPDIAAGAPDASPDRRTYTFHLVQNAAFSNGDPVTSSDFVYSWNRAALASQEQNGGAADFSLGRIDGYQEIIAAYKARQPIPQLTGLSTPDSHTLMVHLTAPSGSWLDGLALPPAWLVDRKAIKDYGEASWWTTPPGLIGTGPFQLTARTPKQLLVFTATRHWWGGSTGGLTRVELHVLSDAASQWQAYRNNSVDVLGYGVPESGSGVPELASSLAPELESLSRAEIRSWTLGRTEWVGFNFEAGPFSAADGRDLRLAFSQAIDRAALARAVCKHGWACRPATGGLIAKGLQGYLGDGADSTARFDRAKARTTIARLDPSGLRLRGLVYTYGPARPFLAEVAENLHDQWKANLGVDVTVHGLDTATFFISRGRGQLNLFRGSWLADYAYPDDWFDNLFTTSAEQTSNNTGSGYSNSTLDAIVAQADLLPPDRALSGYQQAGRLLLDDSAIAVLFYYVRTEVAKPYVQGDGANPLWDYRWTSIRILQH